MNITRILTVTLLATTLTAGVAFAGPRAGGGNRGARANRAATTQICPQGNEPGSRLGVNQSRAGKARRAVGNPNSTGTPLRDGTGKATAPGNGPKDGTGNNPRHPVAPPAG